MKEFRIGGLFCKTKWTERLMTVMSAYFQHNIIIAGNSPFQIRIYRKVLIFNTCQKLQNHQYFFLLYYSSF